MPDKPDPTRSRTEVGHDRYAASDHRAFIVHEHNAVPVDHANTGGSIGHENLPLRHREGGRRRGEQNCGLRSRCDRNCRGRRCRNRIWGLHALRELQRYRRSCQPAPVRRWNTPMPPASGTWQRPPSMKHLSQLPASSPERHTYRCEFRSSSDDPNVRAESRLQCPLREKCIQSSRLFQFPPQPQPIPVNASVTTSPRTIISGRRSMRFV